MQRYELLAPAGDLEKLNTACYFGADAVYVGGPRMHLRAQAASMTEEDLKEGIDRVHALGKRIYVSVNAFAHNRDLEGLGEYAQQLDDMGADAVIVSDLGVLRRIKRSAPALEVHISTQANCTNYETARMYHEFGASRIVLARELSLQEIAELREKTPRELCLEAFVHGAMCMSYSGRCLISSFLTGRDANQGDCAQPCRWEYALMEASRPGAYFPIEEDGRGSYLLSSSDLNMISHIQQLKQCGVTSFKIEGRMKTAYYVATMTNAYRRAIDESAPLCQLEQEVRCASHRAFSTGFYFGAPFSAIHSAGYEQDCVFCAVVQSRCQDGRVWIEQRNKFEVGQVLEILSPHSLGSSFRLERMWDADTGEEILCAPHPQQQVLIQCPYPLEPMDMLRRRNE